MGKNIQFQEKIHFCTEFFPKAKKQNAVFEYIVIYDRLSQTENLIQGVGSHLFMTFDISTSEIIICTKF